MEFERINIESIIMHEVPRAARGDKNPPEIRFSDVESETEGESLSEIRNKISRDLTRKSRSIVVKENSDSRIPEIVQKFFTGDGKDFVETSKDIARVLRETQNGVNSAGLLAIARVSIAQKMGLAIVKLEHETAVRAEFGENQGKKTVRVSHLKDLLFSNKAKVYKVGLFVDSEEEIGGYAADQQSSSGKLAKFFLEDFLGCQYRQRPDELTRHFFEVTMSWINNKVDNPQRKSQRFIELITEMGNNEPQISVNIFANRYLEASSGEKDSYVDYMTSADVENKPFAKDTSLVANKINEFQYKFSSGVVVITPPSAFDEGAIKTSETSETQLKLTVEDTLEKIESRTKKAKDLPSEVEPEG